MGSSFFFAVFLISVFVLLVTSGPSPTERFPHFAILDRRNESVWLYWKFDDVYITFEIHGRTTGWVGMGISPSGSMIGADMFVGWVKNGVSTLTDRHGGSRNSFPSLKEEQNLSLLGGGESEGWTWLTFKRQLASCETGADQSITTSTLRIIWALGDEDPKNEDIEIRNYHGSRPENRGVRSLLLLEPANLTLPSLENKKYFDVVSGNVTIPTQDTYYNCRYLEFPRPSSKHHIVAMKPLVQPTSNEDLVHHMLLYECEGDPRNASLVGNSHECYVPNMPEEFLNCTLIIYAWAIGGGRVFNYPDHVGFPFGTDDSPRFVMLEIHYDNPNLRAGVIDNSGVRMIYTDDLREYDAAILEIGRTVTPPDTLLVPPSAESFPISAECRPSCIGGGMSLINRTDIKIFAGLLHSHLLGRAMKVRHFTDNDNKELPFLLEDNSYDFNYQEMKVFTKEVTVRRGDSLQMVCDYNSSKRTNFTLGGLSTQNEMCLSYIHYYPKISVTSCRSFPLTRDLLGYFNITAYRYTTFDFVHLSLYDLEVIGPYQLAGRTVGDIVHSVEWTRERIEGFQRFTRRAMRINNCVSRDELKLEVSKPYQTPVPQCISPTTTPVTTTSSGQFLRGNFVLVATILLINHVVKTTTNTQ